MSKLLDKATHKVKKKVGQAMDRLRPSSRGSRATSPVPSHQSEQSTSTPPGGGSQSSEPTVATAMAQASVAAVSVAIQPTQLASPVAADASSPPLQTTPPAIPTYAQPPSPPTILSTTGSAVKSLLVAVRDGSDLFLPLKAALVGIVALWDVFDRTVEAKAEFTKLESRLSAFKAIADAYQDEPREVDQSLQSRLASMVQAVQSLWEAVEKRQGRGVVAWVAQSSIDLGDIKALVDAISSLLDVFQFESSIAVEKRLGVIVERLEVERNDRLMKERMKEQEKAMKTIKSALGDTFVPEAADYGQPSYTGCMAGTRVAVLSKFVAWVKEDPMSIFWLAGMAGTGKTSIAVSLCRMLRNDPTVFLCGGYFCSRSAGSIARTDVRRILPTLATLLAYQSQEYAKALAVELEKDRNLGYKPVTEQIGPLLRQPLATLVPSSRPLVFVIDVLDECSNERELAELLRLLTDLERDAKVKFILTSRPELHIRGTPISNPVHNTILQLHTISAEEVTSDIRLYISARLNDASPEGTWYTERDIGALVMMCGGLFIFASTVLLYVLDPDDDYDRRDRLHRATSAVATCTAAITAVDRVYELVLTGASRSDTVDAVELDRMKHILACILTARAPLSVEALAALIEIHPGRLRASLRRLHSLVHLPTDDKEPGLRTLHASLGDYLHHRASQPLKISVTHGHDVLARSCLRRMRWDDLCFNISHSTSSFAPNPEIAPEWIPDSLIYACLHWAHHIDASSNRHTFDADIDRNFRPKCLFWLEVLSVLRKVGIASGLLRIAGSAVTMPVVSQFLSDANAFVASSHEAISRSAPHIYTSALPFAAKDSLIYHDFAPLCAGIVSVTTFGTDRHGSNLVATLSGHEDAVRSVAYSPDGLLIASGSLDGTVRIWDTRTGEEAMTPLRGNDGKIWSVAFSPRDQLVASAGAGKVVHVWDVATGHAAMPPLRGHSAGVTSVSFSPDGMLIASGSTDTTVRLWSAATGAEIFVMSGHTGGVKSIAFAPDGQWLASASVDKSVRLWESNTGRSVGDPLTGLDDEVHFIGISPDGKHLAAGSWNTKEIRIWDVETRRPTPVIIKNYVSIMFLVFSPDGQSLLSSRHRSIRSWDTQTGRELLGSTLAGHSDWVNTVSLSPDGQFLASGSDDRTIRIWNSVNDAKSAVQPLQAHTNFVTSVAVSQDGASIVSGSSHYSVRIWDALNGEAKLPPLLGHSASVFAVSISSDGRLIASASVDRTVRIWNVLTGKSVGEPHLHGGTVRTVAFSPDARWLVSGSDDKHVHVWDVENMTSAPFGPLDCRSMVLAVAFSLDGRLLAAGDFEGYVHIWRSGTNHQTRKPLQVSSKDVYAVALSPDAKRIASGGTDTIVRVHNVDSGNHVFLLKRHLARVRSVAYSPDGLYIVSCSEDKTVRLWDASTGTAISTFFGHGDVVRSVAFHPDGRTIVSGADDGTIHTWDVEEALSLSSRVEHDPLARLGSAALDNNGWLAGPSGELLLWVPPDYRGHIQLPPCSMIIGSHRVFLAFDDVVYCGDQWTNCWRHGTHPVVQSS